MTDSYRAPGDLAAARIRMEGMAGRASTGGELVYLTGQPFQSQQHNVSASVDVVVADMVLWRFDQASLNALSQRLMPGMVLLFLEPTAELGWRRAIHRYGRAAIGLVLRHNFERDVPAELRSVGLLVTTTVRFTTGPGGLRSYVLGRAEHIPLD